MKHGVEAHLLHAGAAFDVVGARYGDIAAGTRDEVLTRHPRAEAKRGLVGTTV